MLVSSKQPSLGWLPAVYSSHPPRPLPHADFLARDITSPDFLLCCRNHCYSCNFPFFWQGQAVYADAMDCWSWWLAWRRKFLKASCLSPLIETLSLYLYSTCFIITKDILTLTFYSMGPVSVSTTLFFSPCVFVLWQHLLSCETNRNHRCAAYEEWSHQAALVGL